MGSVVHWAGELNSPRVLRTQCWTRTHFKPGDQITITVFPSKDLGCGHPAKLENRLISVLFPEIGLRFSGLPKTLFGSFSVRDWLRVSLGKPCSNCLSWVSERRANFIRG